MSEVERHGFNSRPDPSVARAWTAVVLIPLFFFLSMAAGYVAYDLMGYKPENDDAPMWVDSVGALASLVVLWLPCAAAVVFGGRATRAGHRSAAIAAAIGALVGVGFTLLSVVTVVS